jgi:ABC-2 type transport system ATP-binding protein
MDNRRVPARVAWVTKRYGAVTALDAVDFALAPRETLALLGAGGSGKTTALRVLLGSVAPDAGAASLFGRDPRVAAHRKRVGAMPEAGTVRATPTVAEHVRGAASEHARPLPLDRTLALAGLHGLETRPYGELSAAEKQRVAFALAICGDPDVLILDEPTAALDVESRLAFWVRIRRYAARGGSILVATDDPGEAQALADRIVVLACGRVVADGTAAELRARAGGVTLEAAYLALTRSAGPDRDAS